MSKNVCVALETELATDFYNAMASMKKTVGRRVANSEIIVPAVKGFIRATEEGKGEEYLRALTDLTV